MQRFFPLFIISFLLPISAYAQGGHKQVAEGNKLYEEEKYDEANNKYRDALIEKPESAIINFNIGDVQYQKRNFEEAMKSYDKATSSEDILLQSQSYYNIGNTLYKLGKLPESILAYKKALELNPDDEDAKYNLEYVRAKLKDNAQKEPQQNQDQQQQQEQKQDRQNQEQDQNQQAQQEQEQQDEQSSEEQQNQEEQQQGQEQQQAAEKKEISKEDAERILNALKNEEQDLLKQQRPKRRGRPFRGKDW